MRKSIFKYIVTFFVVVFVITGCNSQIDSKQDSVITTASSEGAVINGEESGTDTNFFNWQPAALHNAGSHPANIYHEGMLAGIYDKLYFVSFADAGSPLCICGSNGENFKYTEHIARGSINLDDDYIYYLSGTYGIIKQGMNDDDEISLYDETEVWRMILLGDHIFFIAFDGQSNEKGILYSMDKDGENLHMIDSQVLMGYLDFDDHNLYFAKTSAQTIGKNDIYKYDISSLTSDKIGTINGSPKQIINNMFVYDVYTEGKLCLMNLDTGVTIDIFKADFKKEMLGSAGVNGNMVFYTTANINNYECMLFAYDINTQTTFCLGRVGNTGICFANDTLFTVNVVTGSIEKDVIKDGAVKPAEILTGHSGIS